MELPAADGGGGGGGHRKVAVLAALGFLVGLSWPSLAGKHIGRHLPGAHAEPVGEPLGGSASVSAQASASPPAPAPSSSAGASAPPGNAGASAPPGNASHHIPQRIAVDSGVILTCWHGKEKIDGAGCGKLKLDRVLVPLLEQLGGCPSAVGLSGDLELHFDVDFDKKRIHVKRGKRAVANPDKQDGRGAANELPATTVSGILSCVADAIREVDTDKIPHERVRYRVQFGLHFFPPGAAPQAKTEEEAPPADAPEGDVAAIAWDSALLRDEPRTGKVVARLVRGTRVKILGGRKDWYEVKMGNRQGWLYRGALGR